MKVYRPQIGDRIYEKGPFKSSFQANWTVACMKWDKYDDLQISSISIFETVLNFFHK